MTDVTLNPEKTAVIIIDMLNDFIKEGGSLVVPGAIDLVPVQAKILDMARKKGFRVLYLADHHRPDDEEFKNWPAHAVIGTEGAEVIDELSPVEGEKVIPKRRYSGFFGTDLDLTLREDGIEKVILMGVLTNICVMYTSADASARNYDVIVVSDGTWTTDKDVHDFALQQMKDVHDAEILKSEDLLSIIS